MRDAQEMGEGPQNSGPFPFRWKAGGKIRAVA